LYLVLCTCLPSTIVMAIFPGLLQFLLNCQFLLSYSSSIYSRKEPLQWGERSVRWLIMNILHKNCTYVSLCRKQKTDIRFQYQFMMVASMFSNL